MAQKQSCVDLINEAGVVRPVLTNLRSMLDQRRDCLEGRDVDSLVHAIIAGEVALSVLARSNLAEKSEEDFVLVPSINSVPVYPAVAEAQVIACRPKKK